MHSTSFDAAGHKNTMSKLALVSAFAATLLAGVLGGLQSVVWNGAAAPALAKIVAAYLMPALLTEAAASEAAVPPPTYFVLGRLAIGIYFLLWLAAVRARSLLPVWARRAAAIALVVATCGDVIAYWLSADAGPWLRRIGFWYLEVPALGVLTLVLTLTGVLALRHRREGRTFALVLPAAAAGTALLQYLPHGILAGLGCALFGAVLGAIIER